jgi:FMN phosphatase YigB (HAD superfamily)
LIAIDKLKRYLDIHGKIIKTVSFDVFDTLLIRLIPTERVSQLSAYNLYNLLRQNGISVLSEKDILKSRSNYVADIKKKHGLRNSEWTISQWLHSLAQEKDLENDLLIRLGRQAELEAEEASLRIADNAHLAIEEVKSRGLMAIAVSDMWLDQEWLQNLLERFGFSLDHIFTSGTMGGSKKNGKIFRDIEGRLRLSGDNILHVGNKFIADYLRPRSCGWKSLWFPIKHFLVRMNLPLKFRIGSLRPRSFENIIQMLEVPPVQGEKDPYYRLAYDYLAPVLIIFSMMQWRIFSREGIEIAYYLARDSYMMKYVYDMINDLLPGSCPRCYVHLSRRSVALAHPDNLLQNAIPLSGKVGRKTVGDWLGNFTIKDDLHYLILKEAKLNEDSDFNDASKSAIRNACLSHLKEIEKLQESLRAEIRDYLIQHSGKAGIQKIGIVDSGWACTIQDSIRTSFGDSFFWSGMYLGVSYQGDKPSSNNHKYGLLRDDFRRLPHHNPMESSAGVIRVWDTLLREPKATVAAIERLPDGKVIPVFLDTATIGEWERLASGSILEGVRRGTADRLKGVALIARLNECFTDTDFEMAATAFAHSITTCPDHKTASAIIHLGFDEGTAGGKSGSLGWKGIKEGVSWYPGILAGLRLGWASSLLKMVGRLILKRHFR